MKEDSEATLSPSDRTAVEYTQKLIEQRGGLSLERSQEFWRFSTKAELRGPTETDERFVQGIKDALPKEHGEVSVYFLPGAMKCNSKQGAKLITDASQGNEDAHRILREVAIEYLQGRIPLPDELADYLVTCLQQANSSKKQSHKTDYRDWLLAFTVDVVARRFKLKHTRNDATEKHCACSIVALATELSESTVQNAWDDYKGVADQRTATNYNIGQAIFTVTADGAQRHFSVRFPRVGSTEAMSRPSNRKAERAKRNRLRRKNTPR
jgi:hypothetical protein